jgi:hypothetical protein
MTSWLILVVLVRVLFVVVGSARQVPENRRWPRPQWPLALKHISFEAAYRTLPYLLPPSFQFGRASGRSCAAKRPAPARHHDDRRSNRRAASARHWRACCRGHRLDVGSDHGGGYYRPALPESKNPAPHRARGRAGSLSASSEGVCGGVGAGRLLGAMIDLVPAPRSRKDGVRSRNDGIG